MQRDVAMADLLLGTPAAGIGVFYVLVFATAEFSRNVVDKVSPNFLKVYFYEIIGTITMCLCVFENGFVLVNYGYLAFLIVVTIVLYTGATMNRGAQVSPLGLFENVYYGGCSFGHFVAIFFVQIISAASAYLLVPHIWFNTSSFLAFHRGKVEEMVKCNVKYKTSFTVLVLFEFFASTLIRVLMPIINSRAPDTIKSYVIPAFISSMITLSIYVQGAAGLNPIVASSRMLGCDGLDMQLFLFLYWVVTTSGYIFGASISRVFFPVFYKPQKEQWKARPVPKSVKEEISKKQKAANHKSRKAAKQD